MKIYIKNSDRPDKKYLAEIHDKNKIDKVYFGDTRYEDFTNHKDEKRKEKYISRHKKNEDWTKSGLKTAGFWARWVLWNKPTLKESIEFLNKKYKNINFIIMI